MTVIHSTTSGAAACRRNLPVIAYEAIEAAMASGIEADLHLPQHVKDFSIEQFLQSLNYTISEGLDSIAMPGGKVLGRCRLVAWTPPRRR
jgi:hypothetical protein